MVKKNFRLKLNNNAQVYTNVTLESNNGTFIIYHFLSTLRHSNAISEQLSVTNNLTHCIGYSKIADGTYFYDVDKDDVGVRKCAYNNKTNTICKGNLVDTIKWVDGKIRMINKF